MKRRHFLSMLGAASVAPMVPLPSAAAPVAAGYNRYMYGLAVFQARTRASLGVADLVTKLRVSPATAQALMGEMQARGVLTPMLNAAAGTMRAVAPTGPRAARFEQIARRAADHLLSNQGEDTPTGPKAVAVDTGQSGALS